MALNPMREVARQMRREGKTLAVSAQACEVTKVCVSYWCRDLPEHRAATARNTAASHANRAVYPRGFNGLRKKLQEAGVPPTERLRLVRQAAAEAEGRA